MPLDIVTIIGAPLSYRRFSKHFETLVGGGFSQCYYRYLLRGCVGLGSNLYLFLFHTKAWGEKPIDFFVGEFLKMGDIAQGVSFEFVGMVVGPLIAVWIVSLPYWH